MTVSLIACWPMQQIKLGPEKGNKSKAFCGTKISRNYISNDCECGKLVFNDSSSRSELKNFCLNIGNLAV